MEKDPKGITKRFLKKKISNLTIFNNSVSIVDLLDSYFIYLILSDEYID